MAATCEVSHDPYPYKARAFLAECPRDIQAWMDRVNGCAYVTQQKGAGDEPAETLEDMAIDLECDLLNCDYHALLTKYRGNGVLTGIVSGYAAHVYGKNTPLPCDSPLQPL